MAKLTRESTEAGRMVFTTVGEYRDAHDECTGEFFGQDGELLESDAPITILGNEWCPGHYDGNQTWEPLS